MGDDAARCGDAVVITEALTCRFGVLTAVDQLTFEVHEAEIFGLLGHNGAGKTTTVRLLNGLLAPDSGGARVFGLSPSTDGARVRRLTGVLTETPALDERLTARENLVFFAQLYGLRPDAAERRAADVLGDFELEARADDRVGAYSKGMKQRLALARLLLHEPRLLCLDEPTAGLDPAASRRLHELILRLRRDGARTVLLCTHNLFEAERLCDRVAVLARGRVLALGTPAEIAGRCAGAPSVAVDVGPAQAPLAERVARGVPGVSDVSADGDTIRVRGLGRGDIPALVRALAAAQVHVYRVAQESLSLADAYFALQRNGDAAVPSEVSPCPTHGSAT